MLGHSTLESTVRYLGIEGDDALEISVIAHCDMSEASATPLPLQSVVLQTVPNGRHTSVDGTHTLWAGDVHYGPRHDRLLNSVANTAED